MKNIINIYFAIVWFINGLFCKILNLVPRHELIVGEILSESYSREIIITIGVLEVVMAIWILSRYKVKVNAMLQITIILLMNIIEFIMVPDLLLWGMYNLLFSIIFCIIIYWNAFINHKNYV